MSDRKVPGVGRYGGPAGGWGALQAVAKALRAQMALNRETQALRRVNQPQGFDCPGCAWPDPRHASSFEFCENGAKAVAWEATRKRADLDFFAAHSVSELWKWTDFALEDAGRLTHPLVYDRNTDHFVPIEWEDAFARIGEHLRRLPDPNMAEFYTSGRASNEAAFLYQLFVREFGTNNFPDCSNLCHEATSVGLPESIGVGKGTVTLEDFDYADAVFCIGHNPGTNHPRMLATLRQVSKRGGTIVVFNPLRERGLERFVSPQSPVEMVTQRATQIATVYHQPRVGGDAAFLKGLMKALLALDEQSLASGGTGVLDKDFIAKHTAGYEALVADLNSTSWDAIVACSGLTREELESTAEIYAKAERVRRAADRQPRADARPDWSEGRRALPAAWPLQRAGRPHRRHHRDPDRRIPRPARVRLRLLAAARAWARRRRGHQGHARRPVESVRVARRQSCRCDV
jgi:molybdopterin-dependent oxidoreductase alpha subunit